MYTCIPHLRQTLSTTLSRRVAPGSEYSVLVVELERRSRIESRWRGERGVGP